MAEAKGYEEGKRSEEALSSLAEKKEVNSRELVEKIEAYFYTDEALVAEFESFVANKAKLFVSIADGNFNTPSNLYISLLFPIPRFHGLSLIILPLAIDTKNFALFLSCPVLSCPNVPFLCVFCGFLRSS